MLTPAELGYDKVWFTSINRQWIKFWITVCQDAHIALAQFPGVVANTAYEVIIGLDNQHSVIRKTIGGHNEIQVETSGILSCTEGR